MTVQDMRRRMPLIAAAVVVAVAVTIAVLVVTGRHHDVSSAPGPTAVSCGCPGYVASCGVDPDNCDGGDRALGGAIVVAVGKSPRGWNPGSPAGNAGDTAEEMTPLLPSAYTFMPSGKIEYNRDLLVSEPQVVSQIPQRLVYKLNPAARWNDGAGHSHPVTAQDFVFARRSLDGHDKKLPLWPTPGYDRIASVVGSDGDLTVTVTFRTTYPDWRGLFARLEPYWFAAAASGADPAHAGNMTDAQLEKAFAALDRVPKFSAGPYMIKEVRLDGSTVEVPNPLWYGTIEPALTTITFRPAGNATNVTLMAEKKIDVFTGTPDADIVQQLTDMPGINYNVVPSFSAERLQFNTADPFLRDGALREAIMDAIDVQRQMAATLDNEQQAVLLNEQDKILTRAHVDLPLYRSPQLIAIFGRYVNIRANSAGGYFTYNAQEWGLLKTGQ